MGNLWMEFWKPYHLARMVMGMLLLPLFVILTLKLFFDTNIVLDAPIVLILFLLYYVSLIPIWILYTRYRDKRESQIKIEQRDLEDKVWKKNLRK